MEFDRSGQQNFCIPPLSEEGIKREKILRESFDNILGALNGLAIRNFELFSCLEKVEDAYYLARKTMAMDIRNLKIEKLNTQM